MKRLLFVDDEPRVLEGLQRMLYPMRHEWETTFVGSGQKALDLLAASEYDILITDVRMPEMSGLELLSRVAKLYPQVVRIVLSGALDLEITVRSASLAHQFLPKPCDSAVLRAAVEHALKNHFLLENPALKQLISRMPSLPTIPSVYLKLMDALKDAAPSAEELGQIIAQDMVMTARILQLANSPLFGPRREAKDPVEAAALLGIQNIRSLALTLVASYTFEKGGTRASLAREFQDHGLAVGSLARRIAESLSLPHSTIDSCFTGGLLHDLGKLVLAISYPDTYEVVRARALDRRSPIHEVEAETLGTTHPEVGAYLLWLWGIPENITEIVALHHTPPLSPDESPSPVLLVHVADALVNERMGDINQRSLESSGLAKHLPSWQDLRTR